MGLIANWYDYVSNLTCCFSRFILYACFCWGWTTEECDAIASPKKESVSVTGNSDADPTYSWSDDAYKETSDEKSS